MPKGRPKKAELTNEQKALQMIAENPAILEALTKLAGSLSQSPAKADTDIIVTLPRNQNVINTKPAKRYKPTTDIVFFDTKEVGPDPVDKQTKKKQFRASERREPLQKHVAYCECGASYESTTKFYDSEIGYTCPACRKARAAKG